MPVSKLKQIVPANALTPILTRCGGCVCMHVLGVWYSRERRLVSRERVTAGCECAPRGRLGG